ncbi:hypothetical protein FIBSPDRAFT_1042456 [Athelia psychrophila]|uniref:Uncharacterized protein n=1 Tax=Athelia psychrophila TaxID=1759441 RepID=A0A166MP82_9AGAM|nr:hypothetical protein FIBSPDRAFT_1042456 [Fibularhizoctonia sp. CBS 109695]
MVLEKPVPKNTQDHADARTSIPEHLLVVIATGDDAIVPTSCPVLPLAYTISPPLSLIGGTSPSIKDTLVGRQELTATVLEAKSNSTAAVKSTSDPASTAPENSARHESQASSAKSPTHEEPTSENGPKNAISPVDIESRQGNAVDTEDQGRRAKNSEIGQGKSNIQDGNNSSVEELTPKQQRLNAAKLKKENEEAERVKNETEAERVRKERKQAKRARKEAERIKNETEQTEIRK